MGGGIVDENGVGEAAIVEMVNHTPPAPEVALERKKRIRNEEAEEECAPSSQDVPCHGNSPQFEVAMQEGEPPLESPCKKQRGDEEGLQNDFIEVVTAVKEEEKAVTMDSFEVLEKSSEDVRKLRKICDNVGSFYDESYGGMGLVVRMALDTSFLEESIAKQWRLDRTKAIVIQLKFDPNYLMGTDIPDLFVFQSNDAELDKPKLLDYLTDFGVVQWFLETRLTSILRKNWFARPPSFQFPETLFASESSAKESPSTSTSTSEVSPLAQADPAVNIEEIRPEAEKKEADETSELNELVKMGFGPELSKKALERASSLSSAIDLIVSGIDLNEVPVLLAKKKEEEKEPSEDQKVNTLIELGATKEQALLALEIANGNIQQAWEYVNTIKEQQGRNTSTEAQTNASKGKEKDDEETLAESENFWRSQSQNDDCFLAAFYRYAKERFLTCNSHCLICDKSVDVASMLRFPVCSNPDCVKTYELSPVCVASNAVTTELTNNPEVVDLLINLLIAATASSVGASKGLNRKGINFEPYPWGLGFDNGLDVQNHELLEETCNQIPPIYELKQCSSDEQLKAMLDDRSVLLFPLLRWIVCSSRPHLTKLTRKEEIPQMRPALQFKMISSTPEHEEEFLRLKAQARTQFGNDGSFFAFHGSPVYNWHSILRTGLRSGHVPGIYMAQNRSYSMGYIKTMAQSQSGATGLLWKNTALDITTQMNAMSLIEVADFRAIPSIIQGGISPEAVNIARLSSYVVTRYLFVWPSGAPTSLQPLRASSLRLAGHKATIPRKPYYLFEALENGDEDDEAEEDGYEYE